MAGPIQEGQKELRPVSPSPFADLWGSCSIYSSWSDDESKIWFITHVLLWQLLTSLI